MFKYSKKSKELLAKAHPDLQKIYNVLITIMDITIIETDRSLETQQEYLKKGVTTTLNSYHLVRPDGYSWAVDAMPCPVDYKDRERICYMQGMIRGIAKVLLLKGDIEADVTVGIDWDNDGVIHDHAFFDGPHTQRRK